MTLTAHYDTNAVRIFESFAGENLEKLTTADLWDLTIVLAQSTLTVEKLDGIGIQDAIERSTVKPSPKALSCLDALNGFPSEQVSGLVTALLKTLAQTSSDMEVSNG